MKKEPVYLNELTLASKGYRVKVKVIEKNRSKESPQKKIMYQALPLQDDKGNKMKAALFGDQVDAYKDLITYNGEYEIANAIIRPIDHRWKGDADALDYQMTFGKNALIQPLDDPSENAYPDYLKISQIPKMGDMSERFDILAVVLFIEDSPGKQITFSTRTSTVRELMIIDENVKQPLVVSAWHDLAEHDCDVLHEAASCLPLVGLTAMKTSNHKGFSVTTTMSTTVIHEPVGEQARELQSWVSKNRSDLIKMRLKILAARDTTGPEDVTTIAHLLDRKAADVLQDERHNLSITVPEPDFDKLNAYVGCSVCGKSTETLLGKPFMCEVCHKPHCVASPKVTFKCDVLDSTGSIPLTLFTDSCEALFNLSVADIFHMRHSDDYASFDTLKKKLQTQPTSLQIGPSTSLSRNKVLQWVLQQIHVSKPTKEEENTQEPPPVKRRLRMAASSTSSDDPEAEPAIEEAMIDTVSSMSQPIEEHGYSPTPSASPASPLET